MSKCKCDPCKCNVDPRIRGLFGMKYSSIEVTHLVVEPLTSVLRDIADYLQENGFEDVIATSLSTQGNPDNDNEFLTTFVWAN